MKCPADMDQAFPRFQFRGGAGSLQFVKRSEGRDAGRRRAVVVGVDGVPGIGRGGVEPARVDVGQMCRRRRQVEFDQGEDAVRGIPAAHNRAGPGRGHANLAAGLAVGAEIDGAHLLAEAVAGDGPEIIAAHRRPVGGGRRHWRRAPGEHGDHDDCPRSGVELPQQPDRRQAGFAAPRSGAAIGQPVVALIPDPGKSGRQVTAQGCRRLRGPEKTDGADNPHVQNRARPIRQPAGGGKFDRVGRLALDSPRGGVEQGRRLPGGQGLLAAVRGKEERERAALRAEPDPLLAAKNIHVRLELARGDQAVVDPAEGIAVPAGGRAGHDPALVSRDDHETGPSVRGAQFDNADMPLQKIDLGAVSRLGRPGKRSERGTQAGQEQKPEAGHERG